MAVIDVLETHLAASLLVLLTDEAETLLSKKFTPVVVTEKPPVAATLTSEELTVMVRMGASKEKGSDKVTTPPLPWMETAAEVSAPPLALGLLQVIAELDNHVERIAMLDPTRKFVEIDTKLPKREVPTLPVVGKFERPTEDTLMVLSHGVRKRTKRVKRVSIRKTRGKTQETNLAIICGNFNLPPKLKREKVVLRALHAPRMSADWPSLTCLIAASSCLALICLKVLTNSKFSQTQ